MPEDSTQPNFIEAAERVLARILPVLNRDKPVTEHRHGLQLCVTHLVEGEHKPILLIAIGRVPPEKSQHFQTNALEKAMRLSQNSDISSWLTRDPGTKKYGGGIRAGDYIISASGLPEIGDEVFDILVAEDVGLPVEVGAITQVSGSAELYQQVKATQ